MLVWRTPVPTSQESAQIWRWTTSEPSVDWRTSDIWIRRTFRADTTDFALAALKLHHDEDAEVYLNGQQVAVFRGFVTDYFATLAEGLARAMVVGHNLLAIHCHNTVGGQFIDAGIEVGTEIKEP